MSRQRIASVDLLRGLTITAMILVNTPGSWSHVYAPLLHAEWHGWTPTDLVFPFFLYIVGCSIAFAYRDRSPTPAVYRKITVRALKLIGLGLFLGAFTIYPPFFKPFAEWRFPGVLQRIGVCFFVAALVAIHAGWRTILGVVVALLVGYWAWLGFVPLPDGAEPTFARAANNWAMYLDKLVFGNHTWQPDYDPEGLASTLPSVATTLIGVLAGRLLTNDRPQWRLPWLLGGGAGLLALGLAWSVAFPINKALWTSSFVLVTAGVANLLLGSIYWWRDVRGRTFGELFRHVGANALLLYFLSSFLSKVLGMSGVHAWVFDNVYVWPGMDPRLSSLLYALTVVSCYLALGEWLWRRKIFWRV